MRNCLLRLILLHTATGLSLRQTMVRARVQELADISDVALLKRLRCSEAWLQWLTVGILQIRAEEPVLKKLASRRLRVVDATTVEEQGGAGTDWRVHHTLCLPTLSFDFFELTDVHGEESYMRIPVKPGDLLHRRPGLQPSGRGQGRCGCWRRCLQGLLFWNGKWLRLRPENLS